MLRGLMTLLIVLISERKGKVFLKTQAVVLDGYVP